MPAFSHFFLKRLSARSKFSSSWIMTSDKFYFPPSWRLCAGMGQTAKLRRRRRLGQAKTSLFPRLGLANPGAGSLPVRRRRSSSAATLAFPARTLALSGHPKPPTTLPRSARSRVSSSRSLCKAPTRTPSLRPCLASGKTSGRSPVRPARSSPLRSLSGYFALARSSCRARLRESRRDCN